MHVYKTILGYASVDTLRDVINALNEPDVKVYLDDSSWAWRICGELPSVDITILEEHKGIQLAPLRVYEDLADPYTHLLHLDDDLILSPSYYQTLLSAAAYVQEADIVSCNIHKAGEDGLSYSYSRAIPQWSNVLLSKDYVHKFLSSKWYDFFCYYSKRHDHERIASFCRAKIEELVVDKNSTTYQYLSSLKDREYSAQDVFQNIFILCHEIKCILIDVPRLTLKPITRTNVTEQYVRDICESEGKLFVDKIIPYYWEWSGINHLDAYWKD